MLDKIITYSFYLLFFLTPLFWTSLNYELFEFNKMLLTYAFTTIIVGVWILKMIKEKTIIFKRTPLDIVLLIFLASQVLSTIFSIDIHTSIWGYYSRLNGGLLSIISYLLLYWAFVSNMDFEKVRTTLKFGFISGFLISLWAILEHFGVSLSCIILRNEFNASCWVQDVQARVFATLGQPNWLASYLAMLIFPALYFLLTSKTKSQAIIYSVLPITYYLAFTFTYSRGPTLGLIGGMIIFIVALLTNFKFQISNFKKITSILISFLIINLLFGSALTSFRLVSKFAAPARPAVALPQTPSVGTQLENGGTESGQIRLIVWKGALDIFKHYPIFGSGLETFAYSYYQYRPVAHNLTSEWDFLYNKAHNEYLNYLATTGLVGFGTYMLVIGVFVVWTFKKIVKSKVQITNVRSNLNVKKLETSDFDIHLKFNILILALLASYISYLISNFFLFSVVIIAVFFYLFPALVFVALRNTKPLNSPAILNSFFKKTLYLKTARIIIVFLIIYLLYSVLKLWYADTLFAQGQAALSGDNPGRSYNLLVAASDLNKGEPLYRSELGLAAAEASSSLMGSDATLSAALKDEALSLTDQVLSSNPKNVSLLRTAVRTYFALSTSDKAYMDKTLQILDRAIALAPTDPKLYYNKALILSALDRKDEEIKALEQTIKLKPNYLEALAQLQEATKSAESK